jgi:SAM-dependent methyltransferase
MPRVDHLLRATARAEGRHFWFRGFRAIVTPLIRQAIGNRPDSHILDCGCGTGANVQMLERFGRAFGFDLSPVGLQIGREMGRSRLVRASATAAPFHADAFDLVTSFDVLYSLPDRDERMAVAEMFRMTRPGGYVIINVAALKMLSGDHSVLSREVRRYSRADLRRLVSGAGFTIVRLTYTNFTLVFPLAAVRLVQRWRGLAAEEDAQREISVPPAPINGALSALLRLEAFYLRVFNSPIGSSLICLARKPETPAGPRI